MGTLTIKDLEYNDDLEGFIVTLSNDKVVQVQFDIEANRLSADCGQAYAIIDKQNEYGLDLTDDEEESVKELISDNEEIRNRAELWKEEYDRKQEEINKKYGEQQ